MSIDKSFRSMSADSGDRRRFVPGYDFSYRFQSAKPFLELKALSRPHTTPDSSSAQVYRTGRHQQAYVNAIASAQTPSIEAIKRSLGDGLLMLQQGSKYVKPTIFANLDKIHLTKAKETVKSREGTSPAFFIPRQPPLPTRSPTRKRMQTITSKIRSQSAGSSTTQSRGVQVNRGASTTPANATRRPSTVGEMVVEFLTNVDKKEQQSTRTKVYRPRSNSYYSTITELDDRCLRNSDFPQIQIDGRTLSQTMRTGTGFMPREHCDVLGPLTCPDCIRTRSQNSHQRMCSTSVAANATDVYKLALIHERIPHLGMREVQRKVFDGEISDKVNSISRWKEMQQYAQPKYAEKEESTIVETIEETVEDKTRDQPEKSRPKLRSRGSLGSVVFETIAEASESPEIGQSGETGEVIDQALPISNQKSVSKEDDQVDIQNKTMDNEIDTKTKEIVDNVDEVTSERPQRTSSGRSRRRSKNRKKSPKRHTRIFNRGLIPSPNYFYNVGDLMGRVQKLRRTGKRNPWEVDIDIPMPLVHQNEEGGAKPDANKDDAASISSQDSVSPRKADPMTKVEPPIMYEKKSRYLGLSHPTIGNIPTRA
uniref:uncharacterized protein LOC120325411 n=1 Tax=Styela clava TaxID=7725 RepID=UPI001939B2F6|nr:uncharacterized protein LOC120325411 [Styela clava]